MKNVLVFEITLLGNPSNNILEGSWSISEMTNEVLKKKQCFKIRQIFKESSPYFANHFISEDSHLISYGNHIDFYYYLSDKVKNIANQCDYISFVLESQN